MKKIISLLTAVAVICSFAAIFSACTNSADKNLGGKPHIPDGVTLNDIDKNEIPQKFDKMHNSVITSNNAIFQSFYSESIHSRAYDIEYNLLDYLGYGVVNGGTDAEAAILFDSSTVWHDNKKSSHKNNVLNAIYNGEIFFFDEYEDPNPDYQLSQYNNIKMFRRQNYSDFKYSSFWFNGDYKDSDCSDTVHALNYIYGNHIAYMPLTNIHNPSLYLNDEDGVNIAAIEEFFYRFGGHNKKAIPEELQEEIDKGNYTQKLSVEAKESENKFYINASFSLKISNFLNLSYEWTIYADTAAESTADSLSTDVNYGAFTETSFQQIKDNFDAKCIFVEIDHTDLIEKLKKGEEIELNVLGSAISNNASDVKKEISYRIIYGDGGYFGNNDIYEGKTVTIENNNNIKIDCSKFGEIIDFDEERLYFSLETICAYLLPGNAIEQYEYVLMSGDVSASTYIKN